MPQHSQSQISSPKKNDSMMRVVALKFKAQRMSDYELERDLIDAAAHGDELRLLVNIKTDPKIARACVQQIITQLEDRDNIALLNQVLTKLFGSAQKGVEKEVVKWACLNNKRRTVFWFVSNGEPVYAGGGAYIRAAATGGHREILSLLAHYDRSKAKENVYLLALDTAIQANKSILSLELIEMGALKGDPNFLDDLLKVNRRGDKLIDKPVFVAAEHGLIDVWERIVADSRMSKDDLYRCLSIACARRDSALFTRTLEMGADINTGDGALLKGAIKKSDFGQIVLLLGNGAIITDEHLKEAEGKGERTSAFLSIMKLLLEIGTVEKPVRELLNTLDPEGTRRTLKSDAFLEGRTWQTQPLVRVLTRAAAAAAVFAPNDRPKAMTIFKSLALNDIARVEEKSGLSWRRYDEAFEQEPMLVTDFTDVINEVADVIFLPILARDALSKAVFISKNISNWQDSAREVASDYLYRDKGTLDVMVLNSKWHRGGNRCPDELRPLSKSAKWYPLFEEPVKINEEISIVCLNTAELLSDEGAALSHCVAGYASSCETGDTHILSIRKNGQPLGTVELRRNSSGQIRFSANSRWDEKQFRGRKNSVPPVEATKAWDYFKELVRREKVEVLEQKGITPDTRLMLAQLNVITKITRFSLSDSVDVRDKALKHYHERVMIVRKDKSEVHLFSSAAEQSLKEWIATLQGQEKSFEIPQI